jgi:LCP family protein required for cell wall assembly
VTIQLLGVDSREGETDPPRSDTMIVVRVDPVAKRVDMLSIPRDLLVEIPGFYATKINAAYPFGEANDDEIPGGGPTLAAQTVEYNFGIRIDYFAEVDIAGMERIIDILGGVMVDVERIVKDDPATRGCTSPPACNGWTAKRRCATAARATTTATSTARAASSRCCSPSATARWRAALSRTCRS